MIRLGIIGCGGIASFHTGKILQGYCPEITVTAAADRRKSRRQWAKEQFPNAAIFEEGIDLIASDSCDAVLICTPHYQHPELSSAALRHGKHVISEKPAGVYTLQVREEIKAAEEHPELTFAMMFNQRTNCLYRKMKELLSSGKMGQIKRVTWIITDWYRTQSYYDSGSWRATWDGEGGGVLLNQCPHQLDLLQWLCGMPSRVQAHLHYGKWHDIEVEDDVTAYLEFPNGATGVFITTTGDCDGINRLEITTEHGKLLCEHDELICTYHEENERQWCYSCKEVFGTPKAETTTVETDGKNPQHVGVLNAFAAHILRGEPLVADGKEGLNGLMLSNAMHLSDWLGKPVELPFDEELFLRLLNERRTTSRKKEETDIVLNNSGSFGSTVKL
ncbi:MAG: Gfo/Idh/MocA family oxidoreductase [Dorea formicigenerans]|nr:Gfo/Idh/MocA family oxidoreductase [Dorea formicigenerans]